MYSQPYPAFVRVLLLTAQRRDAVRNMRWHDGGVWTIPKKDRQKGNAGKLKLPPLALSGHP
jgi:hypothetical protein